MSLKNESLAESSGATSAPSLPLVGRDKGWGCAKPQRSRYRRRAIVAILIALAATPSRSEPHTALGPPKANAARICDLIDYHAGLTGLPRDFLARLIWKESRFDPNAVSPAGAEGVAQFMPGTAKMRGLENSFDIEQAIPASARYLAEMRASFGNLGLAAAAYNSGENRVTRWLASGGFLPLETEDYVLDIMGEPADSFSDRAYQGTIRPLDKKLDYAAACRTLPAIMSETIAMASVHTKPWGIQVAGNFRRAAAIRQWQRLQGRFRLLKAHEAVVSRVRTPIGRRGIFAVRIGADNRGAADAICTELRRAGGACLVMRNR